MVRRGLGRAQSAADAIRITSDDKIVLITDEQHIRPHRGVA
jgi:hypothetical protein